MDLTKVLHPSKKLKKFKIKKKKKKKKKTEVLHDE